MTSREREPSARVAEILDQGRDPGPLQLPTTLAQGRYRVRGQAVVGVALIVALAVVMLGSRYVLARQQAVPEPVAVTQTGAGGDAPTTVEGEADAVGEGTDTPFSGAQPPTSAAARVTVHVVGRVKHPGVLTLAGGSRVGDALDEAGGAASGADVSALNLARPLVDGEQVRVPAPGETPVAPVPGPTAPPGVPATGAGQVNLNTADPATLETLPGVGPVLAQRIVEWRTEHGRFTTIEELGEVSGIGEKTFEQLSSKVTV